jgi:type II secretory pathway component PulJ
MTLVEMMVTAGVGSLLLITIMALFSFSNRSMASLLNYAELERQSQRALDIMSRDIRQVGRLVDSSSTSLTFIQEDGSLLRYAYNSTAKTLTRTAGYRTEVLLEGCDSLQFNIMQRNTQSSTFDQFPAGSTATCKLLQLQWLCSRKVLGAKLNTESMQSAKIVIRAK